MKFLSKSQSVKLPYQITAELQDIRPTTSVGNVNMYASVLLVNRLRCKLVFVETPSRSTYESVCL